MYAASWQPYSLQSILLSLIFLVISKRLFTLLPRCPDMSAAVAGIQHSVGRCSFSLWHVSKLVPASIRTPSWHKQSLWRPSGTPPSCSVQEHRYSGVCGWERRKGWCVMWPTSERRFYYIQSFPSWHYSRKVEKPCTNHIIVWENPQCLHISKICMTCWWIWECSVSFPWLWCSTNTNNTWNLLREAL